MNVRPILEPDFGKHAREGYKGLDTGHFMTLARLIERGPDADEREVFVWAGRILSPHMDTGQTEKSNLYVIALDATLVVEGKVETKIQGGWPFGRVESEPYDLEVRARRGGWNALCPTTFKELTGSELVVIRPSYRRGDQWP